MGVFTERGVLDPKELDLTGITPAEAWYIQEKVDRWRKDRLWKKRCENVAAFFGCPLTERGVYLVMDVGGGEEVQLNEPFVSLVENLMRR